MELESDVLSYVAGTTFADRYYDLCERFPIRPGAELRRIPFHEVLDVANCIRPIRKCDGPGHAFQVDADRGSNGTLTVVVQGNATLEVSFKAVVCGKHVLSTFAVLASEVERFRRKRLRDPPYPRPVFYSKDDLNDILIELFCLDQLLRYEAK